MHIDYYKVTKLNPIIDKLTVSAAVTIFHSSDENGRLIGTGLGVEMADLKQGSSGLIDVFQRWFDAGKDVSWDTLIKLCDDFPRQLSKAKSDLLKYIGKLINYLRNNLLKYQINLIFHC